MNDLIQYWPIITGVAVVILLLLKLVWEFGRIRLEMRMEMTNLATRLESAEEKVRELFKLHNRKA